jgi:hypothetical protein
MLLSSTLTALATLALPSAQESRMPTSMLWGHSPTVECLWHAEFAKEGLAVDTSGRSFSVGYGQPGSNSVPKVAVLQVRDANGAKLSQSFYSNGTFQAIYAGLWVPTGGNAVFAVGTQFTGNSANPAQMIVSRWAPGSGTPWTTPVLSQTAAYTPAQLGLLGTQVYGCRILKEGPDVLVSGCTESEMFVARIDRATLQLVLSWGIGGARSVWSMGPNSCPPHDMPGGFVDFAFHRQSFIELTGTAVYLGGTLTNDLPGVPIDHDFVVAGFDLATGVLAPFGVQYSRALGHEYMKALAVTPGGVYAVGTHDPTGSRRMMLVPWRTDGSMRAPFWVFEPTPSRGNDVEIVTTVQGTQILIGGQDAGGGATWRFRHGLPGNAPVTKPPLWNGAGTGSNPKPYTAGFSVNDEVFDLGLGTGTHTGYVFSAGALQFGPGSYGQNLLGIAPNGITSLSNNAIPTVPGDDRAVAVTYHTFGGGTVMTHGATFDAGSGWLLCPGHWGYRSSRYMP